MKIFLFFCFLVFLTKNSYAYIDPGTGSMLLQILGSILIGCVVFFRYIKMQILNFYYKFFKKKSNKKV